MTDMIVTDIRNLTSAIFLMPDPYLRVEQDVPTYDVNSFFGDAGGFLGLLLGAERPRHLRLEPGKDPRTQSAQVELASRAETRVANVAIAFDIRDEVTWGAKNLLCGATRVVNNGDLPKATKMVQEGILMMPPNVGLRTLPPLEISAEHAGSPEMMDISPLAYAIWHRNSAVLRLMLQAGFNANFEVHYMSSGQQVGFESLLALAARTGSVECARTLLDMERIRRCRPTCHQRLI
ncbi:unnamed protein product [Sphagnum tenellum]